MHKKKQKINEIACACECYAADETKRRVAHMFKRKLCFGHFRKQKRMYLDEERCEWGKQSTRRYIQT